MYFFYIDDIDIYICYLLVPKNEWSLCIVKLIYVITLIAS
jgi:hypothetical protein